MKKATFNKKLQEKIQEAQVEQDKVSEAAMERLLDNKAFIEAQRSVSAKEDELKILTDVVIQLNAIPAYVTKDGRKFNVNVFPVSIFGTGLGTVMGIINGSRSAFVDEKMLEFSLVSGISMLELQEAQALMGSPAYFKDGKVHDAIPGDYDKLKALLDGIFIKLGLTEFQADSITEDRFDLWFATSEAKANKQLLEHEKLKELEAEATDFVLAS